MLYQVNCAQRKYNRELLIHVRSDHHVTAETRISQHLSLSSLFISDNAHGDCCCCLNYTEPFYSSFDSYCLCNNITRSLLLAVNEPRGQPLIIGSAQYILTFPIKFHLRFVCFSP